jgi:hypothetical protein
MVNKYLYAFYPIPDQFDFLADHFALPAPTVSLLLVYHQAGFVSLV